MGLPPSLAAILQEQIKGSSWRNPTMQKAWMEAEKVKVAERKKLKEEENKKKVLKAEQDKTVREELAATGRLNNENGSERLAQLKKEVEVMEAKDKRIPNEQIEAIKAKHDAEAEAEKRLQVVQAEVEAKVAADLAAKEKELEKQKKELEASEAHQREYRRRELLEYKHYLGLPSSPTPFDLPRAQSLRARAGRRSTQPTRDNVAIYDDPRFWQLSEKDQQLLESLTAEEQAEYGFGPLAKDALGEEKEAPPRFIPQNMKDFVCLPHTQLPRGLVVVKELGTASEAREVLQPPTPIPPEERAAWSKDIELQKAHALSSVIEQVLAAKGNGLLAFKFRVDPALINPPEQGVTALICEGIAVVIDRADRARQQAGATSGWGQDWGATGHQGTQNTGWGNGWDPPAVNEPTSSFFGINDRMADFAKEFGGGGQGGLWGGSTQAGGGNARESWFGRDGGLATNWNSRGGAGGQAAGGGWGQTNAGGYTGIGGGGGGGGGGGWGAAGASSGWGGTGGWGGAAARGGWESNRGGMGGPWGGYIERMLQDKLRQEALLRADAEAKQAAQGKGKGKAANDSQGKQQTQGNVGGNTSAAAAATADATGQGKGKKGKAQKKAGGDASGQFMDDPALLGNSFSMGTPLPADDTGSGWGAPDTRTDEEKLKELAELQQRLDGIEVGAGGASGWGENTNGGWGDLGNTAGKMSGGW